MTEIEAIEKLNKCHFNYLKKIGIKLPNKNTSKWWQLIFLIMNENKVVHKDAVSDFVRQRLPHAAKDQQVRHLGSQSGWYVLNKGNVLSNGYTLKSGEHCLVNLKEAHPDWRMKNSIKRNNNLSGMSWNDIKSFFGHRCATCGVKEGEPLKGSKTNVAKLEKGHCNPRLPLSSDNIIPQCQYCNKTAKNDFIFSKDGRVDAILNPNFIMRSPLDIQREMFELLSKKFKNSDNIYP